MVEEGASVNLLANQIQKWNKEINRNDALKTARWVTTEWKKYARNY